MPDAVPLRGDEIALPLWRMALRDRDEGLLRLRLLGSPLSELAKRARMTSMGVLKAISRVGYEKRSHVRLNLTRKRKWEIARAYRREKSSYALAKRYGISRRSVLRILDEYDIARQRGRPRGT